MFEPKAHDSKVKFFIRSVSKHLAYCACKLVHVHARGINRAIRGESKPLEEGTFGTYTVKYATFSLKRMGATLCLIASHDSFIFGV